MNAAKQEALGFSLPAGFLNVNGMKDLSQFSGALVQFSCYPHRYDCKKGLWYWRHDVMSQVRKTDVESKHYWVISSMHSELYNISQQTSTFRVTVHSLATNNLARVQLLLHVFTLWEGVVTTHNINIIVDTMYIIILSQQCDYWPMNIVRYSLAGWGSFDQM